MTGNKRESSMITVAHLQFKFKNIVGVVIIIITIIIKGAWGSVVVKALLY